MTTEAVLRFAAHAAADTATDGSAASHWWNEAGESPLVQARAPAARRENVQPRTPLQHRAQA
jgi:hypothetical protein